MDSSKRTMYISKKEFTEWSKTARKKRKLCEESISAATYISKKSVPAVPFSLYLETAYQTPLLPAHLPDSLSVLNTLRESHQDNPVQVLYTKRIMHLPLPAIHDIGYHTRLPV